MATKRKKKLVKTKRPAPIMWTTAAGQKIAIKKMSDDHLANTINYLRLRAKRISDQIEHDDRMRLREGMPQFVSPEPVRPQDISPIHYPALVEEAIKRGIMKAVKFERKE